MENHKGIVYTVKKCDHDIGAVFVGDIEIGVVEKSKVHPGGLQWTATTNVIGIIMVTAKTRHTAICGMLDRLRPQVRKLGGALKMGPNYRETE